MDLFIEILGYAAAAVFMIVFFGLCIIIHELGHFLAAKMCGLHIIAFSIGFKKAWGKKIGGVEYRIGWIPCGGYVDLPQIDATGEPVDENGNKLPKAEPWKRIVTAFAGPFFNVLFALLLGCAVWIFGVPQNTPRLTEFKVVDVEEISPEYKAGLRKGDRVFKLNGKTFDKPWERFVRDIMLNLGKVHLGVKRGDQELEIAYYPAVNTKVAKAQEIPYPYFKPEIPLYLIPEKGSPAQKAGLMKNDRLKAIDGKEVFLPSDIANAAGVTDGSEKVFTVERNGKEIEIRFAPEKKGEAFHLLGINFGEDAKELKVNDLVKKLPAAAVLQKDDVITVCDGKTFAKVSDFTKYVRDSNGKELALEIKRGDTNLKVNLAPAAVYSAKPGFKIKKFMNYPNPVAQLYDVLDLTWRSLKSVATGLKHKLGFTADYTLLSPKHFSGPIGIGATLFQSFSLDFMLGIYLTVIISFSLGLFNLLPLPVLDGGHIFLACLEYIFRRPLSPKIMQPVTIAFVSILISFMLFVTFWDVKRLLPIDFSSEDDSTIKKEQTQKAIETNDTAQENNKAD